MMIERAWIDSLKIHDVADASCPYALSSSNLGSGPPPRTSSAPKPTADGSINRTKVYDARQLVIGGWVDDASPSATADRLAELKGAFRLRTPHLLRYIPYGSGIEYQLAVVAAGALEAPTSGGWVETLKWSIALEAPDPRSYVAADTIVSYEPLEYTPSTFGLPFPLVFPLDFSTASPATPGVIFLTAFNPGNIETPVRLRLDGPVTNLYAIRNLTTGEEIAFNTSALAGPDILLLDTAARTVTLNGVPAPEMIDAAGTTWFELQPGDNNLDVQGTGFTPADTLLTATFRKAII